MTSSKIKELNKALKGHAKSYGIEIQDYLDPSNHFAKTKALVESHLENLLKDMKGFKFIETLEITFMKKKVENLTRLTKLIQSFTKQHSSMVKLKLSLKLVI